MSEISKLNALLNSNHPDSYEPAFFIISDNLPASLFFSGISNATHIAVHNHIEEQIKELIKCLHPDKKMSPEFYKDEMVRLLNGKTPDEYGVWVYYPWNRCMVHLLNEDDFITVRTNRNKHKITDNEQNQLQKRSIGVIGLSVGQSIALTLAMERTCGELRLADFDTVELSNLNRIRAGVHKLGSKKVILAAREIAEIDPFIKVRIFDKGITDDNIDSFFTSPTKLDLLVEVCDGINIKISSRYKARELGIPVVMDTNDRGMLDIERFDLEPDRPVLHGLADGLNPQNMLELTNEQKIPYVLDIVDASQISSRLKATMIEIENTVSSWPQLASSVTLGGAITTDVCRRILLNEFTESGRFYVDLDQIISSGKSVVFNQTNNADLSRNHNLYNELFTTALANSLANKAFPFSFIESGDNSFQLQVHQNAYYQLNLLETGLFLGELDRTAHSLFKKYTHFSFTEGGQIMVSLSDQKTAYTSSAAVSTTFSITTQIISLLSELERIMHFSPLFHHKTYSNLTFNSQPGSKIAFEKTKLPPFAKPLFLMLSDPEAVNYLANWNLGVAISKIMDFKLSQVKSLEVMEIPEKESSVLELGLNLSNSTVNNQNIEPIFSFTCAQLCTDMFPLYQNGLIKINNNLLQIFNLPSAKRYLICIK